MPEHPTIGRIVIYRSRTGNYSVPAMINCTTDTLAAVGVRMHEESGGQAGVPPLSDAEHVHLTVFTPGKPGLRVNAQNFLTESPHGRAENIGGVYQEWDVPCDTRPGVGVDVVQEPGTWIWPVRA